MENVSSQSLKEVYEVLMNSSREVNTKIPYKFRKYLFEHMDREYKVEVDLSKRIEEQNISQEAKDILALIYRDYLVSKTEREELIQREIRNHKEKEKYNPDNLFKKKNENIKGEQSLVVIQKEKNIFRRIFNYLRKLKKRK